MVSSVSSVSGFAKILPDEMFKQNVNKAAKTPFHRANHISDGGCYWHPFLFPFALVFTFGFAVNFAVQILVFSFSLSKYEKVWWCKMKMVTKIREYRAKT